MSESTKLFPNGSKVRLLVGVDAHDGRQIEAGATGSITSVSEAGGTYQVRFDGEAGATATVEAGNLLLE